MRSPAYCSGSWSEKVAITSRRELSVAPTAAGYRALGALNRGRPLHFNLPQQIVGPVNLLPSVAIAVSARSATSRRRISSTVRYSLDMPDVIPAAFHRIDIDQPLSVGLAGRGEHKKELPPPRGQVGAAVRQALDCRQPEMATLN
jgi:hypothetical protein